MVIWANALKAIMTEHKVIMPKSTCSKTVTEVAIYQYITLIGLSEGELSFKNHFHFLGKVKIYLEANLKVSDIPITSLVYLPRFLFHRNTVTTVEVPLH